MRPIAVLGAPSSIGLRPHDETGQPQAVNRAPEALRDLGVIERLGATDLGDVLPPPYQDFERQVNPDHDPDGSSMRRLSEALAEVLAG